MNSIRLNGYNTRMASITVPARAETHPNLRPLNVFRDLPTVADLIELCFSQTMDNEGKRYLQDMRRAGDDNSFLRWANRAAETTSLPLTGYIWEEGGRIVGNASLVPFRQGRQRIYLIANVAVHPQYRSRGIARRLTERALKHARDKKTDLIWLHVRDDNPQAVELYKSLGFKERARRTTWQAATDAHVSLPRSDIAIIPRHPRFWPAQQAWLASLYPDFLAWHRNVNFELLRPGLWNWFYLLFVEMNIRQWAAVNGENLQAALAWIPYGRGEALFGAIDEASDPQALTKILLQARSDLYGSHATVQMEFPSGKFDEAIRTAGFQALRTLIWMQATS